MESTVAAAFARITEEVRESAEKVGRKPGDVRIMAVTKNHPAEAVAECLSAGVTLFGENRVQEAGAKYADFPEAELHLIGHLQRNKARDVPGLFSAVHSIDAERTGAALAKACEKAETRMPILIEVNTSGEQSKEGVRGEDELLGLIEELLELGELRISGLMTLAPFTNEEAAIRHSFRTLRSLRDRARERFPECPLKELSMGMTNDYRIAVEEGSTILRIGTALFGARSYAVS